MGGHAYVRPRLKEQVAPRLGNTILPARISLSSNIIAGFNSVAFASRYIYRRPYADLVLITTPGPKECRTTILDI
jgi:hypothetical protein